LEKPEVGGVCANKTCDKDNAKDACEDVAVVMSDGKDQEFLTLIVPFPPIEAIKWRCKLRETDGTPKIDPVTGLELYSQEEQWFTFDNRRLYYLQRAAAKHWPCQVRCEVVVIPAPLARMRELRKFDTRTFGCTVAVGARSDRSPRIWSWREAVGLPAEVQPEHGIPRQRSQRWRGPRSTFSAKGAMRGAGCVEAPQERSSDAVRSVLLFFLVYLGLRLVVSIFWRRFDGRAELAA